MANISKVQDRIKYLTKTREDNYNECMRFLSQSIKQILSRDISVEEAFASPNNIEIQFDKNKILIDGNSKFSASSEVILKNSLILSLFKLSLEKTTVKYPRFLLLDNIEDKGMTPERSHNLQEIILDISKNAKVSHQIIVTTSMISESLENEIYCIGPSYDKDNKALHFNDSK